MTLEEIQAAQELQQAELAGVLNLVDVQLAKLREAERSLTGLVQEFVDTRAVVAETLRTSLASSKQIAEAIRMLAED